jgi:hypothetical protein
MYKKLIFYILIIGVSISCSKSGTITKFTRNNDFLKNPEALPKTIVYKTSHDYSDLVPVIMNPEKTKIVSYPAPSDLLYKGQLAKPIALKNRYWLDNRGINQWVVFLKYTYESYSQLKETPSMNEMMLNIADKNPLTEMIICGERNSFDNVVSELNSLIDKGFPDCKRVKIISMTVNSLQE